MEGGGRHCIKALEFPKKFKNRVRAGSLTAALIALPIVGWRLAPAPFSNQYNVIRIAYGKRSGTVRDREREREGFCVRADFLKTNRLLDYFTISFIFFFPFKYTLLTCLGSPCNLEDHSMRLCWQAAPHPQRNTVPEGRDRSGHPSATPLQVNIVFGKG